MTLLAGLCGLLGIVLLPGQRLAGDDSPRSPVAVLETALHGLRDHRLSAEQAKVRSKKIEEAAKAITRLDDLFRAVLSPAWPSARQGDGPERRPGVPPAEWDAANKVREALSKRLITGTSNLLAKGDRARQLAILTLIADSGREGPDEALFLGLKPDVLGLLKKEKEGQVRSAALRALAQLRATPAELAPWLKKALKGPQVAERRMAAGVLHSLLSPAPVRGRPAIDPLVGLKDRSDALLLLASEGAMDEDGVVRRLCLAGMDGIALELSAQINNARHSLAEVGDVAEEPLKRQIAKMRKLFAGLLTALNASLGQAVKALPQSDLPVCLEAHKTLRDAATARLEWRQFRAEFPPGKEEKEEKDPLDEPVKAVPALIVSLQHKEVRVRLGAIYVLETLTADAAPAAGALAEALTDENRFVRWGAARALRNMAPAGADKAVPALAKVLGDDSADVRNTSAVALARYGSAAKGAVPALAKVVKTGDATMRLRAVRALSAIGKEGKEATPALVTALADKQASVRAAAATALGRMGALNKAERSALMKALTDEDVEVRRAAAVVLLQE